MNPQNKKVWKITGLILIAILLIIICIGIYLSSKWKGIITKQIGIQTEKITHGLYHVGFKDIKIDILRQQLKIEQITIQTNKTVLNHLQEVDSLPSFIVNGKIEMIVIRGINLLSLDQKILDLHILSIDRPDLQIIRTGKKDDPEQKEHKSPHQLISSLHSIGIEKIELNEGGFEYIQWEPNDTTNFRLDKIDITATDFLIDSTDYEREKTLYCKDIEIQIGLFQRTLPNGLFAVRLDQTRIQMADSAITFNGIKLIPQYDKSHFAIKNPKHTNWMELAIDQINCRRVDFHRLLSEKEVFIDSIFISGFTYENMKNRIIEQAPIEKPMLYEYLHNSPIPVMIRHIRAEKGIVIYRDLPLSVPEPGTITLEKMEGDFYDVTNVVSSHNQYMTITAKAYIEGEGILKANFKFPVDRHNNHFEITGTLGKMHLKRINPMIKPFLVRINDGMVNQIEFVISGSKKQAHLNMLFLYETLNISLLKEKDSQLVRKGFLSSIANGIVLLNDNPSSGEDPRRVHTVTQRNPYRASFHFFCHILFDGMKETVGITEKRQEQLNWLKKQAKKMHILK